MPTFIPLPTEPFASRNDYRTPVRPRRVLSRMFPPTWYFVARMLRTVVVSGHNAKRGRYDNLDWARSSLAIMRALEDAGCRIEVDGMDNLTSFDGPAVIAGNHMSVLETFVLPVLITTVKQCTFVIKPSLMEYPVFGPVMRATRPIVVSRDNPRKDLQIVLSEGREKLTQGISVVLFPQTTRTPTFNAEEFNSLGVKLARNSNVPIIPLALKTDAWANGRWIKDIGHIDPARTVHFSFGEPMRVEGNDKEVHHTIVSFIENALKEWGAPPR